MSNDDTKSKPSAPKRESAVTTNVTGRVKHDERGNAVWEWAVSTGSFSADSPTSRTKKLDAANLALADDKPGGVKSFSPYDNALPEKKGHARKTDLRKLGEWMKLRKQMSQNKKED